MSCSSLRGHNLQQDVWLKSTSESPALFIIIIIISLTEAVERKRKTLTVFVPVVLTCVQVSVTWKFLQAVTDSDKSIIRGAKKGRPQTGSCWRTAVCSDWFHRSTWIIEDDNKTGNDAPCVDDKDKLFLSVRLKCKDRKSAVRDS